MAIFNIVIYLYNHQTMVTETVFILGWTLATNTRYPFPEYHPKVWSENGLPNYFLSD